MITEQVLDDQITMQEDFKVQLLVAKTDKRALNTLIIDYLPFIRKCVEGIFFNNQAKADNMTDAMLAFAHSIQSYNPEQGAFIQYAAAVIHNRLINNARKELLEEKRFFPLFFCKLGGKKLRTGMAIQKYYREEEERNLRLEIEAVNSEFAKWGFSWATLLKNCPKQERSFRIAERAAQAILQDSAMLAEMLKTRQLPLVRLEETFPRKALKRYRLYIVARIMLSLGDYPYIYSFLPYPPTEEESA